ncbi:remorin family protein [Actinidia rufa]|uniref:Remorin family protein n=1 Tax=Actinidia rufa TaxID=165716 RepID=A0A7J0FJ73_9ERIC|nr:remorin family protein [Actinidia rufa]
MLNDPRAATTSREDQDHDHDVQIRDIHALKPTSPSTTTADDDPPPPERNLGNKVQCPSPCRIGEEGDVLEETNPLAIVPDNNPLPSPRRDTTGGGAVAGSGGNHSEVSVLRVKREEWIGRSEQVQKATSWMKKIERKLEEKRAKALEKMQNEVAKAHRKAEEKRASAESKRGTKVARVLEIANLMKAVGRAPSKRSFF